MSASYAKSGRPVWAVTAWVDDNRIFIELPCIDAPPYIFDFSLTEGGLSKALHLMKDAHLKAQPKGGSYKIEPHPKVKHPKSQFTQAQRDLAAGVLKKLKIT